MANEKAIANGVEDAQTWMSENANRDDWREAVAPGQLGADEALTNAMGSAFVAKLFGVENESDAYSDACADYSKAWRETVLEALAE